MEDREDEESTGGPHEEWGEMEAPHEVQWQPVYSVRGDPCHKSTQDLGAAGHPGPSGSLRTPYDTFLGFWPMELWQDGPLLS